MEGVRVFSTEELTGQSPRTDGVQDPECAKLVEQDMKYQLEHMVKVRETTKSKKSKNN